MYNYYTAKLFNISMMCQMWFVGTYGCVRILYADIAILRTTNS